MNGVFERHSTEEYLEACTYMDENQCTLRDAEEHFQISKSGIHKFIRNHLKEECPGLYEKLSNLLDTNKAERASRGGQALKRKMQEKV